MISPCPRYGKDDFKKTRDRTAHLKRKFKCNLKTVQATIPQAKGQGGAPIDHVQGKDRRREKPEPIPKMQAPTTQIEDQMGEGGPGPSTQAYREGGVSILIGMQERLGSI